MSDANLGRPDDVARTRALLRVATRLASIELDAVLRAACEEAAALLDAPLSVLGLRDATGELLRVVASSGVDDTIRERLAPISCARFDAAAAPGDAVVVQALPTAESPNASLHVELALTTAASVLLRADGVTLGYLTVLARDARRFSDSELDLLRALGPMVSRAITNARVVAEQRARLRAMAELHACEESLASGLAFEEVAARAVRACVERLGVAIAWMNVAEPDGRLSLVASAPDHETYPREIRVRWDDTPEGRGPGGRCVRSRTPVQCTDLDGDTSFEPWAEAARRHGLRANLAVPLVGRDRVLGAFGLYSRDVRFFDPERVSFLRAFADLTASALEGARLARERRELEARLVVSDRMASLGTLAAGVAHEINNPLAYVVANLEYALAREHVSERVAARTAEPDGEVSSALRDALEGACRVRDIVRDLKTFSRSDSEARASVDVRRVLDSAVAMAGHEIRHRARLVREDAEVPPVWGNESRLGQVFLNLLVNAAHAIPEGDGGASPGGELEHRIHVATRVADGRVVVEVRDTGAGIAEEIRARIFEPFFTTKHTGQGTGLGLVICHTIVRDHGGEIEVESEPGRGSTFRVWLPIAARALPVASPPVAVEPSRRARILIVDDEALVGQALVRALDEHDVTWLTDVGSAIEELSRSPAPDVVLCDVMMPGAGGIELDAWIAASRPELVARTFFVTGGAFTPATQAFVERHRERCLAKPLDLARLRALVAGVLVPGPA